MNIRDAYERSLRSDGHVRDSAQLLVVDKLAVLQERLEDDASRKTTVLQRLFGSDSATHSQIPGLYLWGGVGRGKTFLMDLFFDHLQHPKKRRVHFHRMMHDVHARLARLQDCEDPLDIVASDIAAESQVLCFDEFFVSDIGDAMILARLLQGVFSRGVTLLATSNSKPDDLYRDGLQRQRFLPAIKLLQQYTEVVAVDNGIDYRLQLLQRAGTWIVAASEITNQTANEKLRLYFDKTATSSIQNNRHLSINGRDIPSKQCAKGIAWFEFLAICDGPRSQSDYIEISRWYATVIVSDVPKLDAGREDQARRFIAMVDEFYDRRVKLIVSASTDINDLYTGTRLSFEFERTISRLLEMQSDEYLALPHIA